jgi:hypothetical protein
MIERSFILVHDRRFRGHLSLSFCIQFFKQHVNIALQHVLASVIERKIALVDVIERKIALVDDACSRLPIIIRSHVLHASNIKGTMGEIASYHERD